MDVHRASTNAWSLLPVLAQPPTAYSICLHPYQPITGLASFHVCHMNSLKLHMVYNFTLAIVKRKCYLLIDFYFFIISITIDTNIITPMTRQYLNHKEHHVIANHCSTVSSWVSSNGGINLYAHSFTNFFWHHSQSQLRHCIGDHSHFQHGCSYHWWYIIVEEMIK